MRLTLSEHLSSLPIRELNSDISIWYKDEHISGWVKDFIFSQYSDLPVKESWVDTRDNIKTYVLGEDE